MKPFIITSCIVAAILCARVHAAQTESQNPSESKQDSSETKQDSKFIKKAAQGNLKEAQLGKLAAQKSENSEVKQFAEHLQTEHQSANEKLQTIAQNQGMQIPQTLSSTQEQDINELQQLSGAEFDKKFATMTLRSHAQAISLYQKEADQGQDPATKQYAQSMVPALQRHLGMAKDVAKSVGVDESTISSILNQYPEATGAPGTTGGQEEGTGGHKHKD